MLAEYLVPSIFLFIVCYGKIKRQNVYSSFVKGAKNGFMLGIDIFPYVLTILIAVALFRTSGLLSLCVKAVSPVFSFLAIPTEVCELVLLKPFSGSGSLGILNDIMKTYGVDSYISRCACVIMGSSETTFYISCVYLSKSKTKKLAYAIPLSLVASFVGAVVACLLCKIF